ncbi:MAG: helix-turn-helix domain-containing protein [Desulfobacterium sp.]
MVTIDILAIEDGLYSNIMTLHDAFFIANLWYTKLTESSSPLFETRILTLDGKPIKACGGFEVKPDRSLYEAKKSDYLIINPFMPHQSPIPKGLDKLGNRLASLMDKGTIVATVCTGAFILAETGLLDHRRATTHWQFARMFKKQYPKVRLEPEHMLVQDGNIISTGAVTAVYSLILHIIHKVGSPGLASVISKALLQDGSRKDQAPYSIFSPEKKHKDIQVLKAQKFIEKEFASISNIDAIAGEVGVSPRHFIRRFKKATGEPPLKYLQQVRIEKAKEKLENTKDTVDEITWAVGYKDISSFGRLFKQQTRLSPTAYRGKFSLPSLI